MQDIFLLGGTDMDEENITMLLTTINAAINGLILELNHKILEANLLNIGLNEQMLTLAQLNHNNTNHLRDISDKLSQLIELSKYK